MTTSTLATAAFWQAALERAIKTAAQTAVALLGVGATGVLTVDWAGVGSAAALAFVLSLLTSVASDAATGGGPSLTNAETIDPAPAGAEPTRRIDPDEFGGHPRP